MNLPGSSKGSKPSRSRPRRPRSAATTAAREDHDLAMKLQIASALSSSGYYCNINVRLSAIAESGLADVTDVDVLAVAHDLTFAPRFIAVTCKSGRNVAVAKEVLYLSGVLSYLTADEGVAFFALSNIPGHLRDLGRQHNVLVLTDADGKRWQEAVTKGQPDPGYFDTKGYEQLSRLIKTPGRQGLNEWLGSDFWFYRDFRNLSRGISRFRTVASTLTGSSTWQDVVYLNVAAHLSLTVLDLCRTVQMLGPTSVEDTTAAYLFGGASTYRGRRDLYSRVDQLLQGTGLVNKDDGPSLPPLEPAYTHSLAELALRFLQRPHASILVPQVLQDAIWRHVGASGLRFDDGTNKLGAQKLAQDLLEFLRRAVDAGWAPKILRPVERSSS